MAEVAGASAVARRALLRIDPAVTLAAVDGLDLRGHAKITAVVGVPLRQLQQRRDVAAFAATAPIAAVRGLLELLALAPLEEVVALLGEDADDPSYDQLTAAIDQSLRDGRTLDDEVAVLAYAVVEGFAAAPHCRRLLEEREEFALPALPEASEASPTGVLAAPREVSAEVREQRRARREEDKRRRRANAPTRPPRPARARSTPPRASAPSSAATPVAAVVPARRRVLFTPLEEARFDGAHPLVGSVVVVDVPFSATDPDLPDVTSKERPALVVAASDTELLVRPVYSASATTREIFQPWRRVGLDHVCYVDHQRVPVARDAAEAPVVLGVLSDAEWNALL